MSDMIGRVAQAITDAIIAQDAIASPVTLEDGAIAYLDQGVTDMRLVAVAAIKAMSMVDAEQASREAERTAVVTWLRMEADACRDEMLKYPESDMAPLYLMRAGYYEQAAGMIGRGAHLKNNG